VNRCRVLQIALFVCLAAAGVGNGGVVRGDVFVLHNGGRLRGTWVNRQQSPPARYEITTEEGVTLTLDGSQVERVVLLDAAVAEYERIAATYPDTVDGQWRLAQWCRAQGLKQQREFHLRRILLLDSDHPGARHGLGYSQVRGQWVTQEEIQRRRGYELHDGRWRLAQEIELLEADQAVEQTEKKWLAQLRRWREMLATEEGRKACENMAAVRDPHAVKALALLLEEEPYRQVKMLYVDALAGIGNRTAVATLIEATLTDPDEEIFHACLDKIVKLQPPHVSKRFVDVLKDDNNVRVNRAAHALGRLEDKSVISPLIDALVTTHYLVIPRQSDAYTTTFVTPAAATQPGAVAGSGPSSPLGGTSFSAGDETKVIPVTVNNQQVLEALIRLSGGVNFGFDRRAWRYWLATETSSRIPDVQSRRDEG
jgi:hypothetical protein